MKIGSNLDTYYLKTNTYPESFSKDTYISFKQYFTLSYKDTSTTVIIYSKQSKAIKKEVTFNPSKALEVDNRKVQILTEISLEIYCLSNRESHKHIQNKYSNNPQIDARWIEDLTWCNREYFFRDD
ncbi:hypothetical protein [Sulfurimonas sp.]|uniref:hypothetical protein n=1 Tax=Sulfurimonas sp. TaxID=2022749 RepID=UPI0025DB2118|nr:hypothetical protein [Sulfurimonas sp.]